MAVGPADCIPNPVELDVQALVAADREGSQAMTGELQEQQEERLFAWVNLAESCRASECRRGGHDQSQEAAWLRRQDPWDAPPLPARKSQSEKKSKQIRAYRD